MRLFKYTEEQLKEAVKTSHSKAEVLRKLGVMLSGGNYKTLDTAVDHFKLNTDHFTGQGWNKGGSYGPKRPIEDYLSGKVGITSNNLKKRLLREGLKEHKCEKCLLSEWMGEPIPIQLDHINGDHKNNRIENLRILCPNCHAQTDNYCGKNIREGRRDQNHCVDCNTEIAYRSTRCHPCAVKHRWERKDPNKKCVDCQKTITKGRSRCKSCAGKQQPNKIRWPSSRELILMVKEFSYSEVGKRLGVSDNAVRKRIKNHK